MKLAAEPCASVDRGIAPKSDVNKRLHSADAKPNDAES
jgi:hypothetical protein